MRLDRVDECVVLGCSNRPCTRGLCNADYQYLLSWGLVELSPSKRIAPHLDKDPNLTYRNAHRRVARVRGRAQDHMCSGQDCARRGEQWAWRHGETYMVDEKTGCFYSGNVWDYEPMCRKCHGAYDRKRDLICVIEGCGKKHYSRGFCAMHEARDRKNGSPFVVRPNHESLKTHCPSGHPYSGDNLIVRPNRPHHRECLACRRERARARYWARKRGS